MHAPETPVDLRTELDALRENVMTMAAGVEQRVASSIRAMLNDGMSVEDIVAAKPTSDLDAVWGDNPDGFVTMTARSLSGQ